MSGLVQVVSASMSQKGICQRCGISRETGSHKKCDMATFRRPYIKYTANTTETTWKKFKELIAEFPDDGHIAFRLEMQYAVTPKAGSLTQ